jgi:hypothetical protein
MLLLAAAGAEWAIAHGVRERELDEPVMERLTRREEKLVRRALGVDGD